jgi:hypothetical protein
LNAAGRSFCQLGCEDWGLADNLPDRENGGDLRGFCPERAYRITRAKLVANLVAIGLGVVSPHFDRA